MSDRIQAPHDCPPITDEDLARLEVEPRLIPFVVTAAQRAEQSSSGEPQLTTTEAEILVETLDRVVSSNTVNPSLKNRCFKVMRKVSPAHGILPKSYYLAEVTLSENIPFASGGSTDIWKGQLNGRQVCVKVFRSQEENKWRFYRDIIGWKYLAHPNVVPFSGVSETLFSFCFINPWMPNGNVLGYILKDRGANRFQLLAQAACGLEYLHSLGIVHGSVNPRNILIDEDGTACLADFGIATITTDLTTVGQGGTATTTSGAARYTAPELLNPSQFNLTNSYPTKESDIYSLAMTAYEVLTGMVPYGKARNGIIALQISNGERPPRPQNAPWLRDQVWNMINQCWSEQRELRWDIRTVFNQLSVSSSRESTEGQRETQTTVAPSSNAVEVPPPPPRQDITGERSSSLVEERGAQGSPIPSGQREAGRKEPKRGRSTPPETIPLPSAPKTSKRRFMFCGTGSSTEELEGPEVRQAPGPRGSALWGSKWIQRILGIFRPRETSRADGRSPGSFQT